ncbi:MAG: invasion associated locus B family protein [Hyphomicrobiaceae bacterium]
MRFRGSEIGRARATGRGRETGARQLACAALAVVAVLALGTGFAHAEEQKKVSSWVKLCEKAPVEKDPAAATKEVCITHHERLDPNTGQTIVSAAVRAVEGQDKMRLMVTVPLGMALPPGMRIVFDGSKDEKDHIPLKYTFCLPNGCTAETEATAEILTRLRAEQGFVVQTFNALGEQLGFQVPLNGFGDTLDGKPVDTKKFANARRQLLLSIREKAIERAKAAAEAKKEGTTEGGGESQQ